MMKSKLPNSILRRVWTLSDIDGDGMLDRDEFAVAMFLIDHKLAGNDIPETLPDRVIPPSKRSHSSRRESPAVSRGNVDNSVGDRSGSYGGRNVNSHQTSTRPMGDYDDDDELNRYIDQ